MLRGVGLIIRELAFMVHGPATLRTKLAVKNGLDHLGTSDTTLADELRHRRSPSPSNEADRTYCAAAATQSPHCILLHFGVNY
jgi:hypothetical protein